MPGASRSEFYFIAGMMTLIMVLCIGAVIFFIKTYKMEMRDKKRREAEQLSNVGTADPSTIKNGDVENV